MTRFKTHHLLLVLGLIVPIYSSAAVNYCIAVSGGFGTGGTSFIAPAFTVPASGKCKPWSGFTKTASSVVLIATGTGCTSSDGKVLTVSVYGTDPDFLGSGQFTSDQIQLCASGASGCPISGQDFGYFGGSAKSQPCTAKLLSLPATHD
jgi:hypothetical protein